MNITKILKERTPSSDHEKIVQALEICVNLGNCRPCPYYSEDATVPCIHYVMYDALMLLKSKEPIEPEVDVDEWRCKKCGHPLEHQEMLGSNILFHEQYAYCPNCGQAVKWNG